MLTSGYLVSSWASDGALYAWPCLYCYYLGPAIHISCFKPNLPILGFAVCA